MAKYKVDHVALEEVDLGVLIDAACRYCNGAEYGPNVQDVLSIIGIVKVEDGGMDEEERKRKFCDRLWNEVVSDIEGRGEEAEGGTGAETDPIEDVIEEDW